MLAVTTKPATNLMQPSLATLIKRPNREMAEPCKSTIKEEDRSIKVTYLTTSKNIPLEDVLYFKADNKYIMVGIKNKAFNPLRYKSSQNKALLEFIMAEKQISLIRLESRYPAYMRISKQMLINPTLFDSTTIYLHCTAGQDYLTDTMLGIYWSINRRRKYLIREQINLTIKGIRFRHRGAYHLVPLNQVVYLSAKNKCIMIGLINANYNASKPLTELNSPFIERAIFSSLKRLHARLPDYIRVNRQVLLNPEVFKTMRIEKGRLKNEALGIDWEINRRRVTYVKRTLAACKAS